MQIYKNLWAGYDCYFVKIGNARSAKNEPTKAKVLEVDNANGSWDVSIREFYSNDLKDAEHYPVVGTIDLKRLIVSAFLSAVGGYSHWEVDLFGPCCAECGHLGKWDLEICPHCGRKMNGV